MIYRYNRIILFKHCKDISQLQSFAQLGEFAPPPPPPPRCEFSPLITILKKSQNKKDKPNPIPKNIHEENTAEIMTRSSNNRVIET